MRAGEAFAAGRDLAGGAKTSCRDMFESNDGQEPEFIVDLDDELANELSPDNADRPEKLLKARLILLIKYQ